MAKCYFSLHIPTSNLCEQSFHSSSPKSLPFQPLKAFQERVPPKGSPKDTGTTFVPLLTLFPGQCLSFIFGMQTCLILTPLGSIITLSICLLLSGKWESFKISVYSIINPLDGLKATSSLISHTSTNTHSLSHTHIVHAHSWITYGPPEGNIHWDPLPLSVFFLALWFLCPPSSSYFSPHFLLSSHFLPLLPSYSTNLSSTYYTNHKCWDT